MTTTYLPLSAQLHRETETIRRRQRRSRGLFARILALLSGAPRREVGSRWRRGENQATHHPTRLRTFGRRSGA